MRAIDKFLPVLLIAVPVLILAVVTAAFWPGLATPDSITTYTSLIEGKYDDWSPVLMQLIWTVLPKSPPGGAMLVLDVALFTLGWYLWALSLAASGGRWTPLIYLAVLSPGILFCIGYLWRDVLLAGLLLCSSGALALYERRRRSGSANHSVDITLLAFAVVTGILGAMTRTNGFFAFIPLAALIAVFLRKDFVTRLLVVAVLTVTPIVANVLLFKALQAQKLYPENSLFTFDLGALSQGADNLLPGDWTTEQATAIRETCYNPHAWDSYKWGECAFVAENLEKQGNWDSRFKSTWLSSIAANPIAYVTHRLRFMSSMVLPPQYALKSTTPNTIGFDFKAGTGFKLVQMMAETGRWSPFNIAIVSPIAWLAYGVLFLYANYKLAGAGLKSIYYAILSGYAYAAGHVLVGVGNDYRYFHWTLAIFVTCGLFVLAAWLKRRDRVNAALASQIPG
jgi:hypothetical protein